MVSEWIRIKSRIIHFTEDTTVTEYFMTDDAGRQLKNVLWVTSKYISVRTGKRIPHDPVVMELLEAICEPNIKFEELVFNERIREIKVGLHH
jgi:acyl-CoA thioester hydrolase